MIFHLGFELPQARSTVLDEESAILTEEEVRIIKSQIRKNSLLVDEYIDRLDLFVNKEKHPNQEKFIEKIRERLQILMDENDTFRKVLWSHAQTDKIGL